MIRRHPALLAALMLCALPERTPTPEEERERVLKKLRTDLTREGESPEEVARVTATLDLEAMEIAGGSIRDWGWAFGQALRRWRTTRGAERALSQRAMTAAEVADAMNCGDLPGVCGSMPVVYRAEGSRLTFEVLKPSPTVSPSLSSTPIEQAIGRTMVEVNRERRARGELGTKRQRKARRR